MQTTIDIDPVLHQEFDRWRNQLGVEEQPSRFSVTALEVLKAHFLLADHFARTGEGIGGVGPKSLHLLLSAVSRQHVGFEGRQKWRDLYDIAATLFYGLIKNHAFHDANKRTALLVALFQLQSCKRIVSVPQREFEELAVRVAEGELRRYPSFRDLREGPDPEVRFIGRFFRKNTRENDKREFRVTYRQLGVVLGSYGFKFGVPHDNRIDIVRDVEERHGLLGLKRRTVQRRVTTIGFRDWGTEVSLKEIREVRQATKLTNENGYDTAVLMQGLNPMESLIAEYRDPLRRLARK